MWYIEIKPFCLMATDGHREIKENHREFKNSSVALKFSVVLRGLYCLSSK
jgi:hypothetical protein